MAGKLRKLEPTPPFGIDDELAELTELCFHCCKPKEKPSAFLWCEACYALQNHLSEVTSKLWDAQKRNESYTASPDELTALYTLREMMIEEFVHQSQLVDTVNRYSAYEAELERWEVLKTSGIGRPGLKSTQLIEDEAAKDGVSRPSIKRKWTKAYIEEQKALALQRGETFTELTTKQIDTRFNALWAVHGKKTRIVN